VTPRSDGWVLPDPAALLQFLDEQLADPLGGLLGPALDAWLAFLEFASDSVRILTQRGAISEATRALLVNRVAHLASIVHVGEDPTRREESF